jgi:hypothetical protein
MSGMSQTRFVLRLVALLVIVMVTLAGAALLLLDTGATRLVGVVLLVIGTWLLIFDRARHSPRPPL